MRIKRYFKSFPSPLPLLFIITATVAVILYGRGYRPDLENNALTPTGLLSATSDPIGSQVYIDGQLRTATNNTLTIDPGWYTVTIAKEGYIPWQKKLRVQGEIVTRTDPFLFPGNPSLSPLTTIGVEHPTLSPDGAKIAYVIPFPQEQNGVVANKAGLWVYELAERPLGLNRDQRQIATLDDFFNFSQSQLVWSPDSTQIMVKVDSLFRLYNTNRKDDFQDVSVTFEQILSDWAVEQHQRQLQKLAVFKKEIVDIATSSASIISISPDETKILYEATASAQIPIILNPPLIGTNSTEEQRNIETGKIYVYDSREDKNFFIINSSELPLTRINPSPSSSAVPNKRVSPSPSPSPQNIPTNPYNIYSNLHWFPTSRHLVVTIPGKIDIMEYDRTNWVTVYSGPFIDNFMAPWPNGSRIIILTNLNPGVSKLPNLYTVNLR